MSFGDQKGGTDMGLLNFLYLGPFAEWQTQSPREVGVDEVYEAIEDRMLRNSGMGDVPVLPGPGGDLHRVCYMAGEYDGDAGWLFRPGCPRRPLLAEGSGLLLVETFEGADPRAEVEWFTQAYGPELAALQR